MWTAVSRHHFFCNLHSRKDRLSHASHHVSSFLLCEGFFKMRERLTIVSIVYVLPITLLFSMFIFILHFYNHFYNHSYTPRSQPLIPRPSSSHPPTLRHSLTHTLTHSHTLISASPTGPTLTPRRERRPDSTRHNTNTAPTQHQHNTNPHHLPHHPTSFDIFY